MADIIQFPGANKLPPRVDMGSGESTNGFALRTPEGKVLPLTEPQAKALGIILAGYPFVFIGIKPDPGGKGADIFSALSGDHVELQKIHMQLAQVIDRAYDREGIPHD